MWLETLLLQTHAAQRNDVVTVLKQLVMDPNSDDCQVKVFFYENGVLHISIHISHTEQVTTEYSRTAACLTDLLQHFGPIHHRVWDQLVLPASC